MPLTINWILLACISLYILVIVVDAACRRPKGLLLEATGLTLAILFLNRSTGFPAVRESFSSVSPVLSIAVLFTCVALGMASNFFFYLKGEFNWRSFVRPLLVSPIVMLPLVGTVESRSEMESLQLISLAILAFQNGFFWRTVFEHAPHRNK